MRVTIDIPDPVYCRLKICAASESRTVNELILRGVELVLSPDGGARKKAQIRRPPKNVPRETMWEFFEL